MSQAERLNLLEQLARQAITLHLYLVLPDPNIPCWPGEQPCDWPAEQCVMHAVPFGERTVDGALAPYGEFMATLRQLFPDERLPEALLPERSRAVPAAEGAGLRAAAQQLVESVEPWRWRLIEDSENQYGMFVMIDGQLLSALRAALKAIEQAETDRL